MRTLTAALLLAMVLLVSELGGPLEAYLDPGTGSMAIQLILGGIVAVLATVRIYWDRVRSFAFRRRSVESDSH